MIGQSGLFTHANEPPAPLALASVKHPLQPVAIRLRYTAISKDLMDFWWVICKTRQNYIKVSFPVTLVGLISVLAEATYPKLNRKWPLHPLIWSPSLRGYARALIKL